MKIIIFCFAALLLAVASAQAQDCRALIARAEGLAAEVRPPAALPAYRVAIESCPATRERAAAYLALARYQLGHNDFAGAAATIEAARVFIAATFGADDIAMASNRQLHGVIRFRGYNDREGARQAFAEASRIRNAKVDAWDESEGPMGAIGHKPSGVKLPARAGGLALFRRDINDDLGTDVSIGYRADGRAGGVSITLYIYRPAGEFAAVFEQEKQAVRAFNAAVVLKKEGVHAIETPSGKIEGRLARFEYAGQGGVLGTRLYLIPLKRDYVKLRITNRVEDETLVDAQVTALLAAIGWPAQ